MDSVVLFVQQLPEGIGKLMHALPGGVKQLFQAAPEFPGQSGMEVVLPLRLFQIRCSRPSSRESGFFCISSMPRRITRS